MKKFRFITTAVAAFAVAIGITGAASAAIFHVDGANGSDSNDGTPNWSDAFKTLTKALDVVEANQETGTHQIWVKQGTYYPTTSTTDRGASFTLTFEHNDVVILGGFPASVAEPILDQRDPALYPTILSGDIDGDDDPLNPTTYENNSYTVVTIGVSDDFDTTPVQGIVLDGFTITAGYNDQTGDDGSGGGIRIIGASPLIANCVVTANVAFFHGGGLYIETFLNAAAPEIRDCVISDNVAGTGPALGGDGGGASSRDGAPVFIRCSFLGNVAEGIGGGFHFDPPTESAPVLVNCFVEENTSEFCGGGVGQNGGGDGTILMINCVVA